MSRDNHKLPLVAALIFSVGLVGCLPESETLDQSAGLAQIERKANSMALSATQFSLQLQNAVTSSDMWRANQLQEGSFAALSPNDQQTLGLDQLSSFSSGEMGAGYCDLDPANNSENNALVTWFENPGGGDFVVKGIGDDASSYILRALNDSMASENIGVNSGTTVNLAGPRTSDNSKSVDLSGCNLNIPDDVPVVFFEQINRSLSVANADTVLIYETETQDCPNGSIGSITERTAYFFDPVTGQKTQSNNPPQIIDTCTGASATLSSNTVQNNSADVMNAMMNTMQANNMNAGDLVVALNDLQDIDCRETDAGVLDNVPGPNNGTGLNANNNANNNVAAEVIETCDTSGVGQGITMVREISVGAVGAPITTMNATVSCNAGTRQPFAASVSGVNGTATPLETWQGTVEFDRSVGGAQATGMQNANISTTVGMRENWQPGNVNCTRREEIHLSCAQMFPQYNNGNFTLIRGRGATFERTNTITTWANANTYTLDTGLAPNQGWQINAAGIDCQWRQTRNFANCPGGYSVSRTGTERRTLTARAIRNVNIPPRFSSVRSLICRRTTQTGGCPNAPVRTTVRTVTRATAASSISSSSSTSVQQCPPAPPVCMELCCQPMTHQERMDNGCGRDGDPDL